MTLDKDTISVVIPTFKRAKYFSKCIQSVVNQFYDNLQIIITDNSNDNSILDIVNIVDDNRITYIRNTFNIGSNANYRKAISHATGGYLFAMASDVYLDQSCLEKHYQYLKKNKDIPLVSAQSERVVLNEQLEIIHNFNDIQHNVFFNKKILAPKTQNIESKLLIEQMLISQKPFQMISFFESLINIDYLRSNKIPLPDSFGWHGMEYSLTMNTLLHTKKVGYIHDILIYGIYNDVYFDDTVRPANRYIPFEKMRSMEEFYFNNIKKLSYMGLNPLKIQTSFLIKNILFSLKIDRFSLLSISHLLKTFFSLSTTFIYFIFTLPFSIPFTIGLNLFKYLRKNKRLVTYAKKIKWLHKP